MSEGTYEWNRAHKVMDWIEDEITGAAIESVTEWFGVDEISELTEEQISEVENYAESDSCYDVLAMGLRNVVSQWENEQE